MVYLPPVVRSLISDTIGKQPFTEICKKKGKHSTDAFSNHQKPNQCYLSRIQPLYSVHPVFSAIRKGYNNPNPVRQYPSASPHKHLPKPALFSKNPVLHLQGHSDKAYFLSRNKRLYIFQAHLYNIPVPFPVRLCWLQHTPVRTQSAGSIASLQYPGNQ